MGVHEVLLNNGTSISVAESCTGGLLGDSFSAARGSSNYFAGGLILYNDRCKVDSLGVKQVTIDRFGVESMECAEAMSKQVSNKFRTCWGVSTTGNIEYGPVYCSLYNRHTYKVYNFNISFSQDNRVANKSQVVELIHEKLIGAILDEASNDIDLLVQNEEEFFNSNINKVRNLIENASNMSYLLEKLEYTQELGIKYICNHYMSTNEYISNRKYLDQMTNVNLTIQEALVDM